MLQYRDVFTSTTAELELEDDDQYATAARDIALKNALASLSKYNVKAGGSSALYTGYDDRNRVFSCVTIAEDTG